MDNINEFREYTRKLERKLEMLNMSDCETCNISSAQCHILVEIGRNNNISLKEVSRIVDLDKSTVCKSVEDLVQRQLITRTQNSLDRRQIELNLSDTGEQYFKQIENHMNDKFSKIFSNISEKDRENVVVALKILLDAFEN